MKKKILIVISGFTHGGTNKSLMNLLGVINKKIYNIEILSLYNDQGPYRELFSKYKLLSESIFLPSFLWKFKNKNMNTTKTKIYYKFVMIYTKINVHFFREKFFDRVGKSLSEEQYDAVLAFQEGFTTELSTYIPSKRHIAWVRCDYSRYLKLSNRSEESVYENIDDIIAVSTYTANVMRSCIPGCANKITAIHNMIDYQTIIEQSLEEKLDDKFVVAPYTLVSVGRMDPVKRFSYIPQIAAELNKNNIPFKWYIIGDGGSEKKIIEQKIYKYNVENEVIMLGEKKNPYPYIRQSSVLVCLSVSEACPNVINEAKILHIPVVSTDFPSVTEFITDDVNGLIAPIEKISDMLFSLYKNEDIYNRLKYNINQFYYDNVEILDRIELLINK